jgi:hypothetical protein
VENDAKYYARRAEEERLAADKSEHLLVRQRHLEMAEAYDVRVRSIAAQQSRETFHLVSAA